MVRNDIQLAQDNTRNPWPGHVSCWQGDSRSSNALLPRFHSFCTWLKLIEAQFLNFETYMLSDRSTGKMVKSHAVGMAGLLWALPAISYVQCIPAIQ